MSASETIKLVQGDAGRDINIQLTDAGNNNAPIDVSASDVRLYYRKVGADSLTDTILCTLVGDGTDGWVRATLTAACMAEVGQFEGEIEITTGPQILTLYKKQRFQVRQQLQV